MAALYGERADKVREILEFCRGCMLHNRNMTGREECERAEGCGKDAEIAKLAPVPELVGYDRLVFNVFVDTAEALWNSGFGKAHVPRHELAEETRARGFELSDHFLEKFAICERELRVAIDRRVELKRQE